MVAEDRSVDRPWALRLREYAVLTKMRLASLVIVSAVLGFFIGAADEWTWNTLLALFIGGTCITGSANGLNQVWEKNTDRLMSRTSDRPLPAGRMGQAEALTVSITLGLFGFGIMLLGTNPLCAWLSMAALLVYVFLYTPLKRITPLAVFVGAFPGAVPPLLGYTAATGGIPNEALMLFALQFMWQFPHFWAIAWRADQDYKKGGFVLLPFSSGHSRENAFQIMLYTCSLIPLSLLPYWLGYIHLLPTVILVTASVLFAIPAIRLYFSCSMKDATRLMFASFFYLPVIQLAYLLDVYL